VQALEQFRDVFTGYFQRTNKIVKARLFGPNNERLDLIMDSFNRLSSSQKTAVVSGAGAGIAFVIIAVLIFYFTRVTALESELNESFNAVYELQQLKAEYNEQQDKYNKLLATVKRRTDTVRMKPFFEEKAQTLGVQLQGLSDSKEPMAAENPMSKNVQYVIADMRLQNISIPRLLDFLIEVEKSNNFLSVETLQIRARYGTRLYFDTQVRFRGYAIEGI